MAGRKTVKAGHVVENGVVPADQDKKVQKTPPASEESKEMAEKAPPASEESKETAQETLPASEESKETAQETPPASEESKETAQETPPASEESKETTQETPRAATVDSETRGPGADTPVAPGATRDDSGALRPVVLKNGASFWFQGRVFKKGEPAVVEKAVAERLVRSGYFERG